MLFAWIATLCRVTFGPAAPLVVGISLGAAVVVSWSTHRLFARISDSVDGSCYAVAILALFAHVVVGFLAYLWASAALSCAAGLTGIAVLASLGIRRGIPFVSREAATLGRARSATHRVVVLALMTIAAILVGELVFLVLGTAGAQDQEIEVNPSLPRFFELTFVTPCFEELCFRGVLLAGLQSRMGPLRSAVASSLLFSLFHPGEVSDVASVFLRSFVWAIAVLRSRSLLPAIVAHAVHNVRGILWVP